MGAGFPRPLRSWLPAKRLSGHLINRPTGLTGGGAGTCAIRPVGGCASEVWKRALFRRPLLGTRREHHLRAMSRRKQAKPQHLCSLEPQLECKEPGRAVPRVAGELGE